MKLKGRGSAIAALAAIAAIGAVVIGQSASAQVVKLGNIEVEIEGSISPTKLSKTKPAPIKLNLEGKMGTIDGSHVPPLKEVFLEFDRNGHLNTKGLASCTAGKLESTLTAQAKAKCGAALIGTGRAEAEIAFPEQKPFSASGPLLIFNGSHGAKQMLIIHVYAKVPAPTTFVTTVTIGKGHGPYGLSAKIPVPTITSGQGSVTGFKATIKKTFSAKGEKQSVLTATCKTGTLKARGDFTFTNGDKLTGNVKKPCTPAK